MTLTTVVRGHNPSASPANRRLYCFLLIVLAGLFLRLSLMPFFCHVDFLSEMRRVHETLQVGYYYPGKTRLVVYFIELFFMRIFLPFLPDARTMFFLADGASTTAGLTSYALFVGDPFIFRTLFLLKIPYLIFDLATAGVLYRLFAQKKRQILAVACWLFNPVTLYTFYIFGRYESIGIFFIAMSIFMLQKKRVIWATVMLGMAVNSREMYVFFIPLFLLANISFSESWYGNAKKIWLPALILILMFILPTLVQKAFSLHSIFAGNGGSIVAHEIGRFWGLHLHWLSPFFAAYAVICLWLVETSMGSSLKKYVLAAGLTIGSFFFCCTNSAHYSSWLVLFPVCMLYFDRHIVFALVLFCCCWLFFWLFNTDAGVFTLFLASPIHKALFAIKTIPELYIMHAIPRGFPALQYVKWFLHTMYAVSIGYLMFKMVKRPEDVR